MEDREELVRRAAENFDKGTEGDVAGYGEETEFEPAPSEEYNAPEEKAEAKEPESELEPEPETEPEPEPEPEPPAPPEPEYETLIVDQQERKVERAEVLELGRSVAGAGADDEAAMAIGKRIMQRDLASENRLADVAKLRSELREFRQDLAKQLEDGKKKEEPKQAAVGEIEEQLAALDERMTEAAYDDLPALRTERAKLTRDLVRATIREEREETTMASEHQAFKDAQDELVKAVAETHPDWEKVLQDVQFQEWLDTNRGGLYRQVIGGPRTTDGVSVPGAMNPAWVVPVFDEWKNMHKPVSADVLNRQQRKQEIDTPVAATRTARQKAAVEPEGDGDYVTSLKKQRSTGTYVTGEDL